jgi:hypothetical protein
VREESHLDDMRAAIRGDFERLAERIGEPQLMLRKDIDASPSSEGQGEAEPTAEAEPDPAGPSRSWLRRLLAS